MSHTWLIENEQAFVLVFHFCRRGLLASLAPLLSFPNSIRHRTEHLKLLMINITESRKHYITGALCKTNQEQIDLYSLHFSTVAKNILFEVSAGFPR